MVYGNIDGYTVRKFRTVRKEGNRMVTRNMDYYNLDMIISVGFRVNSHKISAITLMGTSPEVILSKVE